MLAVIHAMCVYQMVGFFGGGDKNDVRAAETRHPVFLKAGYLSGFIRTWLTICR
jgi:hypothetical protein